MDKIVLDTNVLIDGMKDDNSAAWQIINNVFEGKVELYISHPMVREYRRILAREIIDSVYKERILELLDIANKIEVHDIQRLVPDDQEDDKIIATALSAGADVLLTEDKHLLDLDRQYELRIIKPKEYLNRNEKDSAWSDFAKLIGLN